MYTGLLLHWQFKRCQPRFLKEIDLPQNLTKVQTITVEELHLLFADCICLLMTKFKVFLADFQGINFNLYESTLMSTLRLESKQQRFYSASFFSLLLVCQNFLISKSPLANLFCHATSIVLYLSRKKLFSAAFLKLQECRGMPHLLRSVCRQPPETKKRVRYTALQFLHLFFNN